MEFLWKSLDRRPSSRIMLRDARGFAGEGTVPGGVAGAGVSGEGTAKPPCLPRVLSYLTDLTQPDMAALEIPDDLTHF